MDYAIDKTAGFNNKKDTTGRKKSMSGGALWMALGQEKSQTVSLEI
jgi:hypothetical protein